MSDTRVAKAAEVIAPFGDGTNDTNVRNITITATAGYFEMPEDWWGCYVTLKMLDGIDVYYFFSEQKDVLPDATKNDADKQLGWRLRDGEVEEEICPSPTPGTNPRGPIYLCYDGSAAGPGKLWLRKSSKK